MSAQIIINRETFELVFAGIGSLFAFRRRIRAPLAHIESAHETTASHARLLMAPFRSPGTGVPGLVTLGTYHGPGLRQFWYVTIGGPVLHLSLRDDFFTDIFVQTKNANSWAAELESRV